MQSPTIPLTSRHNYTRKLPGLLLAIGLLIIGCFIYKDYGVGWDESAQRNIGVVNLKVIRAGNDSPLVDFENKDHGAAFELPLLWIEEAIVPATFGDLIAIRHLCSYLFYLAGIWCGYLLALRLFRKQWIALFGMAMLVLQPRIFAHAFFNSKDVPFLTAMLIALYAISAAFEGRRVYLFILAGLACGYATAIRTMGPLLMLMTGILLLRDLFAARREEKRQVFRHMLAFGLSALAALYICWPALWHHPLQSLTDTLFRLSRYTAWSGVLLFNGRVYPASELPWYYIPEWFGISTPVCWLAFGIAGMFLGGRHFFKKPFIALNSPKAKVLLLCAGCFVMPLLAVIALRSVLYDDWRHLYFIYPPFVMMALYAVEKLAASRRGKAIAIAACSAQTIATTAFMVSAHPLQQVYFNPLVSHSLEHLRRNFDYDYWGISYGQGLRYLLAHDHRDTLVVVNSDSPLADNSNALPAPLQQRIHLTNDHEPGAYFLTTFRYHPDDFPYPKIWSIRIGGSTVLQIYRVDTSVKR